MAATSSWKSSSGGHLNGATTAPAGSKITKGRGRMTVKPILKKLQSGSEKNSLDLDRGWEDQQHIWNDYPASRSTRDISFITPGFLESGDGSSLNGGPSLGGMGADTGRPKFQHARSPSGASHISVGTTGSGTGPGRGGFVHPFQQTPRTATPPLLSYAGSMASFDAAPGGGGGGGRDYSPTITENEDDDYGYQTGKVHPYSMSQSSLRRPSLASQRTASFSDMHGVAQSSSNVKTNRAGSHSAVAGNPGSSRMVHGGSMLSSSKSQSDLHLNLTLGTTNTSHPVNNDSANTSPSILSRSTTTTTTTAFPVLTSPPSQSFVASSTSSFSAAPLSPLRTSLEMGLGGLAPRLRSLSEQQETRGKKLSLSDPAEHARLMRERRAKFDEKERLKAEKAARKQHKNSTSHHQSKDAEKRDLEMFQRQKHEAARYSSGSRPGTASGASILYHRNSLNRPIYGVDQFPVVSNEKIDGNVDTRKGKKSGSFARGAVVAGGLDSQQQKDRKSAKNVWTNFVLWIRTTIFKLKRGD